MYNTVIAEVRLCHASHHVSFETEPNRDLKEGESACEDPWYEQPRIRNLPTIHRIVLTEGKYPASAIYAVLCYAIAWANSPPIATSTKSNIA